MSEVASDTENRSSGAGLINLSSDLDRFNSLPDKEFAARLGIPENAVNEFRFHKLMTTGRVGDLLVGARNILGFKNNLPSEAFVRHVGAMPSVNNSCYEVKMGKKSSYAIITQDGDNTWHLFVSNNGKTFDEIESGNSSARMVSKIGRDVDITLSPLAEITETAEDVNSEYHQYAQLVIRGNKIGQNPKIRALPIQLVCKNLNLETPQKISDNLYFGISTHEMKRVVAVQALH